MLAVALVWAAVIVVVLVAWGRFHAVVRRMDGVDETLYVDGLDRCPRREVA